VGGNATDIPSRNTVLRGAMSPWQTIWPAVLVRGPSGNGVSAGGSYPATASWQRRSSAPTARTAAMLTRCSSPGSGHQPSIQDSTLRPWPSRPR
jgi:hypothetical protein